MRTQGKALAAAAGCAALAVFVLPVVLGAAPSADAILEPVRAGALPSGGDVRAELRTDAASHPLTLRAGDSAVVYDFDEGVDYRMEFRDGGASLLRAVEGGWMPVPASERTDPLRGSDLSLSDLSLEFLHWPKAQVIGEETVLTRKTWKIRLNPAVSEGDYGVVVVNIEQESGALLQVECYGWEGEFLKRCKVTKGSRNDGVWRLRQLRVETMEPGTPRVRSRTYLDVMAPE